MKDIKYYSEKAGPSKSVQQTDKILKEFVNYFVEFFYEKLQLYIKETIESGVIITSSISDKFFPIRTGIATISDIPTDFVRVELEPIKYLSNKLTDHVRKTKRILKVFKNLDKYELKNVLVYAAGDIFWCFQNQFIIIAAKDNYSHTVMAKLASDAIDRSIYYMNKQEKLKNKINERRKINNLNSDEYCNLITQGVVRGKSKIDMRTLKTVEQPRIHWKIHDLFKKIKMVNVKINFNGIPEYYIKIDSTKYNYRLPLPWESFSSVEYINFLQEYNYSLSRNELKKELEKILNIVNKDDPIRIQKNIKLNFSYVIEETEPELFELQEYTIDVQPSTSAQAQSINDYSQSLNISNSSRNNSNFLQIPKSSIRKSTARIQLFNKIYNTYDEQESPNIWVDVLAPVRSFTGRTPQLLNLHNVLQSSTGKIGVSQIVALTGLGGIGKSEIARKYCYDFRRPYDSNIVWINCYTKESIVKSFHKLAYDLDINIKDGNKERDLKSIVTEAYQSFGNFKCLIIFDNVQEFDDINELIPFTLTPNILKPYFIITSREINWTIPDLGNINVIQINELTLAESIDLIKFNLSIELTDNTKNEDIIKLAIEHQSLPLVMVQATTYIKSKQRMCKLFGHKLFEISDYLKEYNKPSEINKLLEYQPKFVSDRYPLTVRTTWNCIFKKLQENNDALEIINIMSYLSNQSISMYKIFFYLTKNQFKLKDSIDLLTKYSMINVNNGIGNINKMVQQIIRVYLRSKGKEEEYLKKTFDLLINYIIKNCIDKNIIEQHILSIWIIACDYSKMINKYFSIFNSYLDGSTPLHLLVKNQNIISVKNLLHNIKDKNKLYEMINTKNNNNLTPLDIALEIGNPSMIRTIKFSLLFFR